MGRSKSKHESGKPLAMLVDAPTRSPGPAFQAFASAIGDAIRGTSPPQMSIGVYGDWGSGKSTLLLAIQKYLRNHQEYIFVNFDAWRYERSNHIALPLLSTIKETLEEKRGDDSRKVVSILAKVMRSIQLSLGPVAFSFDGISESSSFADSYQREFIEPFTTIRNIPKEMGEDRLVIFIDDLDRCSPGSIVDLVESINLILNVPGIIFVVALDYGVLISAIEAKYPHVSGHKFVDKLFQLSFRVPPLNIGSSDTLKSIIGTGRTLEDLFGKKASSQIELISGRWLEGNPRAIKRLVNNLILLNRLNKNYLTERRLSYLCSILALDLLWPNEWDFMKRAVVHGGSQPKEYLESVSNSDFISFCESAFKPWPNHEEIVSLVRISSAVEEQEPLLAKETPDSTSQEVGEVFLRRLKEARTRNQVIAENRVKDALDTHLMPDNYTQSRDYKDIYDVLVRNNFNAPKTSPFVFYSNDYPNKRVVISRDGIMMQSASYLKTHGQELPSMKWHTVHKIKTTTPMDKLSSVISTFGGEVYQ